MIQDQLSAGSIPVSGTTFRMALDKAIAAGKEHRKPYRTGDTTCRAGGSCRYCRSNRTIRNQRLRARHRDDLQEIEEARRHGDDDA